MTTNIFLNEDVDTEVWDQLTARSLFHSRQWIGLLCDTYRLKPVYALCRDAGSHALIASCKVAGRQVSLPYTHLSGVLANSDTLKCVLEEFLTSQGYRVHYRELGDFRDDAPRATSIVRLADLGAYWKSLSHNTRNQIRKSESSPFEFCPAATVDDFYPVQARNMHRLGTPVHSELFYRNLRARIPGARIFGVRYEGRTVAAMCGVVANDPFEHVQPTFYSLWASTLQEYNHLYVNYFLYWSMIQRIFAEGVSQIDLGYSVPGSGVFQFKQKLRPVNFGVYERTLGRPNPAARKKSPPLFSKLAATVWTAIPYSFSLKLGPKIRKYLV